MAIYTVIIAPDTSISTTFFGINDDGEILGAVTAAEFTYAAGVYTTFAMGGGEGLNDSGQIVGLYSNATGEHGFVDTNGSLTTIDDPDAAVFSGHTATEAYGINDSGLIVGNYEATLSFEGFVDDNGTFTTIADPSQFVAANGSGGGTWVNGINNSGQIYGFYYAAGANGHPGIIYGFVDTNGNFATIADPLAADPTFGTIVTGVSETGEIVGYYADANGIMHGFVDTDGTFTTINYPGAVDTEILGINDDGEIIGTWVDGANKQHGFAALPGASVGLYWNNAATGDVQLGEIPGGPALTSADLGAPTTSGWQFLQVGNFAGGITNDILWQNTTTGDIQLWENPDTSAFSIADFGAPGSAWQIAEVADFTGGGADDILWQNSSTGDVQLWEGAGTASFASLDLGYPGAAWQILGTGDFTGSGAADVLWQNTSTGDVQLWEGAGGGYAALTSLDLGYPGADWQVLGIGDFTGSGKADVLWQNTASSDVQLWEGAGSGYASLTSLDLGYPGANWQMLGIGQFTGNGQDDILWRNTTTDDVQLWQGAGGGAGNLTFSDLGTFSSAWQVIGIGDFAGNHQEDIVWRNTVTSDVQLWQGVGTAAFTTADLGTVPASWTLTTHTGM